MTGTNLELTRQESHSDDLSSVLKNSLDVLSMMKA